MANNLSNRANVHTHVELDDGGTTCPNKPINKIMHTPKCTLESLKPSPEHTCHTHIITKNIKLLNQCILKFYTLPHFCLKSSNSTPPTSIMLCLNVVVD